MSMRTVNYGGMFDLNTQNYPWVLRLDNQGLGPVDEAVFQLRLAQGSYATAAVILQDSIDQANWEDTGLFFSAGGGVAILTPNKPFVRVYVDTVEGGAGLAVLSATLRNGV